MAAGRPAPVPPERCPCGLGESYSQCCGRLHRGESKAATAELLMRSRFSAFALGDTAYLLATWHPSTRPPRIRLDGGQAWTRLQIVGRTGGGFLDASGTVEFRAHYLRAGLPGEQHENSRFVRADGRWFYVEPVRGLTR
jgi:SEC-C motif-containing protein